MNAVHPNSQVLSSEQNADMVWYRRGRHYVASLVSAAQAFGVGNQSAGVAAEDAADKQLWVLDEAAVGEVRDFVAGVHREAQARLREVAAGDSGQAATGRGVTPAAATFAGPAAVPSARRGSAVDPDGTHSLYGPSIVVHRAIVDVSVNDMADPDKRLGAYGYLGISDHENRVLRSRSLSEGIGYDTLVAVRGKIAAAVQEANADELREFIRGSEHAHLTDLY